MNIYGIFFVVVFVVIFFVLHKMDQDEELWYIKVSFKSDNSSVVVGPFTSMSCDLTLDTLKDAGKHGDMYDYSLVSLSTFSSKERASEAISDFDFIEIAGRKAPIKE